MKGNLVAKFAHRFNRCVAHQPDNVLAPRQFIVTVSDRETGSHIDAETFDTLSEALRFEIDMICQGHDVSIHTVG